MSKAIALYDIEWDKLQGLPHIQRMLYLILRWHMDMRNGRVGLARGISLKGLAEELYVEPVRGRHAGDAGEPSRKAVRNALDGLIAAGLIRPCGNGEVLVFFMPLGRRASARPNDEGHVRGTVERHDEGQAETIALPTFPAHEGHDEAPPKKADEGHTSREKVNQSTNKAAAANMQPVDKKLSTVAPLPLLDDESVADWIRRKEAQRGCVARVSAGDIRRVCWISLGATAQDVAEAYALAVQGRAAEANPAPVNVPYIDSILQRILNGSRSAGCRTPSKASATPRGTSHAEAAAMRMGIDGQRDGESQSEFISRVNDEAEAIRLGIPGRQDGEPAVAFLERLSAAKGARKAVAKHG